MTRTRLHPAIIFLPLLLIFLVFSGTEAEPRGHDPVVYETVWGQKVVPDLWTRITLEVYGRLEPGQPWTAGESIRQELRAEHEAGRLSVRRFPFHLDDKLFVLGRDEHHQLIYLLDTGDGLLLVDPSYDRWDDHIVAQIRELGYKPEGVRWVLLTHCHVDHAQSCHIWQKRGAEIIVPLGDDHPMEVGNLITAWWLMREEADRHFTGCKADRIVHDGDVLLFGDLTLYSIRTPGHTPGSTCYYLDLDGKQILISGDVALHNGRHAWMGNSYCDWDQYLKSLKKLAGYTQGPEPIRFQYLLPGHGVVDVDQGHRSVEETVRVVANIVARRESGEAIDWIEPFQWNWEQGVVYEQAK